MIVILIFVMIVASSTMHLVSSQGSGTVQGASPIPVINVRITKWMLYSLQNNRLENFEDLYACIVATEIVITDRNCNNFFYYNFGYYNFG